MSAGFWRAAVVVGVALALWAAFEWGVPRQGSLVALPPLPALRPNQRLAQAQHLFPNDWIGITPSPFLLSCALTLTTRGAGPESFAFDEHDRMYAGTCAIVPARSWVIGGGPHHLDRACRWADRAVGRDVRAL